MINKKNDKVKNRVYNLKRGNGTDFIEEPALRHWPAQEKPRDRLLDKGEDSLAPSELLAILFRTGIKGKNVVSFSREILINFGSIRGLFDASNEELLEIRGIGRAKLTTIRAALAFGRLYAEEIIRESTPLIDPEMVYSLLLHPLRDKKEEEIWLLALDGGNRYKNKVVLNKGGYGNVAIWAGNVIKKAHSMDAAAIILAHNHPNGKAAPTPADRIATTKLRDICDSLGIHLQDNIIVGMNGYFSFKEQGLI